MKQERLSKYLLLVVFALSLFAFLYVNVHASLHAQAGNNSKEMNAVKVEQPDEEENADLKVPAVSLLSKALDIAEHLLPMTK